MPRLNASWGALAAEGYRGTVTLEAVEGEPLDMLPGAYGEFVEMLGRL